MILPCKCQSEYQDKVHGKGMRVHNPCNYGYRCTVCGNEKGAGTAKPQEESK